GRGPRGPPLRLRSHRPLDAAGVSRCGAHRCPPGAQRGALVTAVGRFVRLPAGSAHLDALMGPLASLYAETERLERWGRELADVLGGGGRLLAVGNGGSACQAQHLTSELVGRYRDDRVPFSALALCTETSALTAIGNDYGIE